MLNQVYSQNESMIYQIHSSDLSRCVDTSFYALGFPSNESLVSQSKNLREMNFGDQEGLHFDGLTLSKKRKTRFQAASTKPRGKAGKIGTKSGRGPTNILQS